LHINARNHQTIYELSTIFNMPLFKQATNKAVFTGAQQMALPERSFEQLKEEGILEP